MKRLAFALATLAILFCTYSPARASAANGEKKGGGSTTVVYPTGQYPADVNNVQAAVSAGGKVLLKATDTAGVFTPFNFGPAVEGSGTVLPERGRQPQGRDRRGPDDHDHGRRHALPKLRPGRVRL